MALIPDFSILSKLLIILFFLFNLKYNFQSIVVFKEYVFNQITNNQPQEIFTRTQLELIIILNETQREITITMPSSEQNSEIFASYKKLTHSEDLKHQQPLIDDLTDQKQPTIISKSCVAIEPAKKLTTQTAVSSLTFKLKWQ